MQHYVQYIFDILFPPRVETLRVRALDAVQVEQFYREEIIQGVVALSPYTQSDIRALIHEAKFYGNTHAFNLLGKLLERYLSIHGIPPNTMIIPIPLSRTRMRSRGYNQVTEIIKHARALGSQALVEPRILIRTRDTKPQTSLERGARFQNMNDAFAVHNGTAIKDKHIFLIDDVITTGATLGAAKAALSPHRPASITCIALAH